jgi:hypothetical protein
MSTTMDQNQQKATKKPDKASPVCILGLSWRGSYIAINQDGDEWWVEVQPTDGPGTTRRQVAGVLVEGMIRNILSGLSINT